MKIRKFKLGERVAHRNMDPKKVMEVFKYVKDKNPLTGEVVSTDFIECVWYENGERQSSVFHQKLLYAAFDGKGLVKV